LAVELLFFKVKTKWPSIDENYDGLLDYLAAQMVASRPTVKRSYKSLDVAIPFVSAAPGDNSASPTNPIVSSQSPLWIYQSRSPKIPAVPSKPRNDSQLKTAATSELVSHQLRNDHNYKSTEAQEAVVGRYGRKCKNTTTLLEAIGEGEHNAPRVVNSDEHSDERIRSIRTVIQDIFYSDNIGFDAALHTLRADLAEDATTWDLLVAMGGCFIVVPIMWLLVKEMLRWVSKD
jgi:hypothetical protein